MYTLFTQRKLDQTSDWHMLCSN